MNDPTAVVVLNWNGLAHTRACLTTLLADVDASTTEIHVVDNGSADDEAGQIRCEFGQRIRLHALPENRGFAGGCNAAMQAILAEDRCAHVALLNNDAEPEPGWLQALVAAMHQDPRIGICASRMVFHHDPDRIENAGGALLSNGDSVPRGRHAPRTAFADPTDLLAACGGAMLLRTAMLRQIGLFRDHFFANFEDLDLSLRAVATGWRIRYVPSAVVRHHLNVSIRKVRGPEFDRRSVRNASWAYLVNWPWPAIVLNLPWRVLCNAGILLLMPLCGRSDVARAFLGGRLQACRERSAIRQARRELAPLRRGSWFPLWWRQRAWFREYLRLFVQRLRGRGTTVMGR